MLVMIKAILTKEEVWPFRGHQAVQCHWGLHCWSSALRYHRSVKQPTNQSVSQSINQSINQSIAESVNRVETEASIRLQPVVKV